MYIYIYIYIRSLYVYIYTGVRGFPERDILYLAFKAEIYAAETFIAETFTAETFEVQTFKAEALRWPLETLFELFWVLVTKCLSDGFWRLILSYSQVWWPNGSQMASGGSF